MNLYRMYLGMNGPEDTYISFGDVERFIQHYVAHEFTGFTVIDARGFWAGKEENSIIIEIISSLPRSYETLIVLAQQYKKDFQQESVLITTQEVNTTFI